MPEEDNYYKWGLFYYKKEDQRIFVPKRIAWTGWTLNFANPYSYLILAILFFIVGIILLIFK